MDAHRTHQKSMKMKNTFEMFKELNQRNDQNINNILGLIIIHGDGSIYSRLCDFQTYTPHIYI